MTVSDETKRLSAWAVIAVAGAAMFLTLKSPPLTQPLVPQLVPVFGFPFAAIFVAGQAALCVRLRMWKGLPWIAAMFVVGFMAGWLGQSAETYLRQTPPYDWLRHRTVGGAGLSGLVLGVQMLRQKV